MTRDVAASADDADVRRARASDRARLLAIWERSVRATHDFLTARDVDALRPLVAAELAGEAVDWWVLTSTADVPIGFLGLVRDTIAGLFLDPDHRGRGGGTRLVAHAQRLRGGALTADVNESNRAARRFYEALGFVVVGRSPTDDGGRPFPLLHMRRDAPAPAYTVGPAVPGDLAALPAIEAAAAQLFAGHVPAEIPDDPTDAAVFEAASAEGRLLVARHDGRPVGFAHVVLLEPAAAHLEELDVQPDHGRRGVGRRLVAAVCDWAALRGLQWVTLTTFRDVPFNRPFYASLGFTVLAPHELSPALAAVVAREARCGLDLAPRVTMRRRVEWRRTDARDARGA